jgi:hypothetical protein
MSKNEIPYGYCHCGCGQKTKIADSTDKRAGWIKGEPRRFLHGHWTRLKWAPLAERFWANIDKRGHDECWGWKAHTNDAGYGMLGLGNKSVRAHRFSYELHYGPIPNGLHVCHKCDNPPCCNPAHLFLGDDIANIQDKVEKGRARRPQGKGRGYSAFTNEQAQELREQFERANVSMRKFAQMHNVNRATMRNIIRGFVYKE